MAHRTRDVKLIAHTAGIVVIADWVFTASAVILQPLTGALLAKNLGWSLTHGWVFWSVLLYFFVGLFWVPVVGMQKEMRDLARDALLKDQKLPPRYFKLYRIWFACGFPAFFAVLAIVWLMIAKPGL